MTRPCPLSDLHCPVCERPTTHEVLSRVLLRCVVCRNEKTVMAKGKR